MPKRYFLVCDFDNTLAKTFDPSPNGINVQRAYQLSLRDIMGFTGQFDFRPTPTEIINNALYYADGHKDLLLENARIFRKKTTGSDSLGENPESVITEMLVQQKLRYLMSEIGQVDKEGKIWPQPCDGALDFLDTIQSLRKEGLPIDMGIISSGHEAFIRKTFEVWGRETPNILVTEDDIRPRIYPKETERRFKPGQFPLALAHYKWLQSLEPTNGSLLQQALDTRRRILYIGDDPNKDLLMGQNGKIESFLYPNVSFETIAENLVTKRNYFDGRPIYNIELDHPIRQLAETGLRPYEKR